MAIANSTQALAPPTKGPAAKSPTEPPVVQTSAAAESPFPSVLLPLAKIEPSKTNPRKKFDGPEFDELVASVRQHGVIQPILVRPGWSKLGGPETFEIVAGERRYRASLKAGLEQIPVVVRHLGDADAMELQIIENLQRQDVTALEEGEGYRRLLEARAADTKTPRQQIVDEIAKKVGKSARYVYGRMKLAELAPEVKAAVAGGEIEVSHADEIARLPLAQHKKALKSCFGCGTNAKGVYSQHALLSIRNFKDVLARGFTAELKEAPWKLDQLPVLPEKSIARRIACSSCTENVEGVCYDTGCFAAKREAFVNIEIDRAYQQAVAEHDPKSPLNPSVVKLSTIYGKAAKGVTSRSEWQEAKKDSCKFYKIGVVVEGDGVGQRKRACLAPSCKVHHPAAARHSSASLSRPAKKLDPKEAAKQEQAKLLAYFQQRAVFEEVVGRVKSFDALAAFILDQEFEYGLDVDEEGVKLVADFFGWKLADDSQWRLVKTFKAKAATLNAQQKAQLYVALRLGPDLGRFGNAKSLDESAAKFKVDTKAVRARASKDFLAKQADAQKQPAPTPSKPAKKAAKKSSRKSGVRK